MAITFKSVLYLAIYVLHETLPTLSSPHDYIKYCIPFTNVIYSYYVPSGHETLPDYLHDRVNS